MLFYVSGVPETNFQVRFENYTQKRQRGVMGIDTDAVQNTSKIAHVDNMQSADGNADDDDDNSKDHNRDSSNVTETYRKRGSRFSGSVQHSVDDDAPTIENAARNTDNLEDDKEEDPNLTELQVVPFQGHPFIILSNDLTYCCKYGKDCDVQYRRKKQQTAQVYVLSL